MHWRHYLRVKTHDPSFLWRMIFVILGSGMLLGFLVQGLGLRTADSYPALLMQDALRGRVGDVLQTFEEMLADPRTDFPDVLEALPRMLPRPQAFEVIALMGVQPPERVSSEEVIARLEASRFIESEQELAALLWESLVAGAPMDRLLALANVETPEWFANYALGVAYLDIDRLDLAAAAFEREGDLHDAPRARRRAVEIYSAEDRFHELQRLAADPRFADVMPPYVTTKLAVARGDWWTVWWTIPRSQLARFRWPPAAMAGITGLCWFLFLLQAGRADLPRGVRWWLCVAGVTFGMLSIWPTFFFIYWQEEVWQLTESDEIAGGLLYYVLGVGLREETAKTLCFLPLVPLIVRRGSELEALIVPACVGLGFATVENAHYFDVSLSVDSVGRFLTANFAHMAMTGIIGLTICRGVWQPRTWGPQAVAVFGVVVFVHGIYDAFIAIPALAMTGLASTIVFILLCYQFFRELRALRPQAQETISLTATFLCGLCLVAASSLVYLSAVLSFSLAFQLLSAELLGLALMAYMFVREMPGGLVPR